MSTLQHKQVKSQKQHLKILGAEGRGPRTDREKQIPFSKSCSWFKGFRDRKLFKTNNFII